MASFLILNRYLISVILAFARQDKFSFFARVPETFQRLYKTKQTNVASCFEMVSRVIDSRIVAYEHKKMSVQKHVMKCGSIDVMQHALCTGLVDSLKGALEHAIRSKDEALISTLEEEFRETRIDLACLVAAVQSGSVLMVQSIARTACSIPELVVSA